MWLLYAFSGPLLWAASTHIDKYLIDRYFKRSDTAVLMVFTALMGVLAMPFIGFFNPGVLTLPWRSIAVMAASGALYMGSILFYLRAIQKEEASVVAPLFQTSTLFTFVLAYLFLGEKAGWKGIGGAVLIVAGTAALSFDASARRKSFKAGLVLLMCGCAFTLALSSVLFKFYAVRDEFWATTFWMFAGEALFGLVVLLRPDYRRQFFALLRKNTASLLMLNGANELINLGGGLGVRYASLLAPLGIVSAVSSTTSVFVFLFGILLSRFTPSLAHENLSRRHLLRKGISAALVTVGVVLINF